MGEEASEDNDYIANTQSAWDSDWAESFGGVDDPENREGWYPTGFIPEENPFYVALPYSDYNPSGRKSNLEIIPWYQEGTQEGTSLIKNRWVKITYRGKSCFAQWENVGPYESDDVDYVFGTSKPKNTYGLKAGIDVSPAVKDCLDLPSGRRVDWQFADDEEVPIGPWNEIVTTSAPNWRH